MARLSTKLDTYDPQYYETLLVRAVESLLSPFGWTRDDITDAIVEIRETDRSRYGAGIHNEW